jgi:DNA-binding transcriptional LysR family regulator
VTAGAPFAVVHLLETGELERLLPGWLVAHELGIYGVTPHRAYVPGRVEVVMDAVRERLKEREAEWRRWTDE